MLYSAKYNFIYSKTHKTASTSCEAALEYLIRGEYAPHYTESCLFDDGSRIGFRGTKAKINDPNFGTPIFCPAHQSLRKIREQITPQKFDPSYKISSIRNPYDQVVSAFHFYTKENQVKEFIELKLHGRIDEITRRFEEFLESPDIHPQAKNTGPKHWYIGSDMVIDKFIRMEYLRDDLDDTMNHLKVPSELTTKILTRIPEFKKSKRQEAKSCLNISDYFNKNTLNIVNTRYSDWFVFGGYSIHDSIEYLSHAH